MKKLITTLAWTAVLGSMTAATSFAAEKSKSSSPAPVETPASSDTATADTGSDKLDLKKLEDNYWSSKDDDFTVVQNRSFTKEKRYFVSGTYGFLVNDAYSNGRFTSISGGYYFNERWGMEVTYTNASISNSDLITRLSTATAALPSWTIPKKSIFINGSYVPFYAKMSFLDRHILYFDMALTFGLGQHTYESVVDLGNKSGTALAYNIGIQQQIFFSRNWAFRFDFKLQMSSQELQKYHIASNASESTRADGTISQQDVTMLFGMTRFF